MGAGRGPQQLPDPHSQPIRLRRRLRGLGLGFMTTGHSDREVVPFGFASLMAPRPLRRVGTSFSRCAALPHPCGARGHVRCWQPGPIFGSSACSASPVSWSWLSPTSELSARRPSLPHTRRRGTGRPPMTGPAGCQSGSSSALVASSSWMSHSDPVMRQTPVGRNHPHLPMNSFLDIPGIGARPATSGRLSPCWIR